MSESQGSEVLTSAQAMERLRKDGPIALPASRPLSAGRLLLDVISEPIFLLLAACGIIYLRLGDRNEALMLLGFVCIVMGITFFQRRRAERSLNAPRTCSRSSRIAG